MPASVLLLAGDNGLSPTPALSVLVRIVAIKTGAADATDGIFEDSAHPDNPASGAALASECHLDA